MRVRSNFTEAVIGKAVGGGDGSRAVVRLH